MDFTIETGFAPHPRTYRSVCEACGVGERSPVVHVSSVSIDHEDGMYSGLWLCHECVREWGRALGMIDVVQADRIAADARLLEEHLQEALAELERLRPVKAALDAAAADYLEAEKANEGKVACPSCGKLVKEQGLGAHQRLAHKELATL